MKSLNLSLLFLLLLVFPGHASTGEPAEEMKRRADSLKTALRFAGSDTARLRLRCELALAGNCTRPGYWDSLVTEAHSGGPRFYEGLALNAAARALMYGPGEKKGMSYNEQGYAIALENGDRRRMMDCFITWASHYCYFRNNASLALEYCFKGLKLASELGDEQSRNALMTVAGTCYFAAGDYKRAVAVHLKCLAIARKSGNSGAIASSLSDVGSDYHGMKQFSKSSEYYLECKKYLPDLINSPMMTEVLNSICSGHLLIRQNDSGYKYAKMALALAIKSNRPRSIASAMVSVAGVQRCMGDYAAAKKTSQEALEIIKSVHAPLLTGLIATNLEEACRKQGDYRGALEAYKLYVKSRDTLSNETYRKQLMEKEFNYNLEKKESENRLLAMELEHQNYFLAIMTLLILFILVVSYLFFRQSRLRSEQESNLLSQKLLRVQMNPHFIFNSLQAIQGFIVNRDVKESVRYLGAFSTVTRHVLENSRTDYIPIQKEIDLLKNYLQLQQLRFMSRFDYVIHVEESIWSSFITVPPMLLQPFIENAVEHGMHDIESGGSIAVRYAIHENLLLMEIVDNGYGMAGRNQHKKRHRSLALEITRERIALMNRREKIKTTFTVSDAFPDEIERKGVKVVFRFALSELKKWT